MKSETRLVDRISSEFQIIEGLHQESALDPCLFTLVMDELTSELRDKES